MPTQTGDLTKDELMGVTLEVRADSTNVYLEATATIDGAEVRALISQKRTGRMRVPFTATVGEVAEEIQAAYERHEPEPESEPSAL